MIARMSSTFQTLAMLFCIIIIAFTAVRDSVADVNFAATLFVAATGLTFIASLTSRRRGGIDYLFCFFFLFFIGIPARIQVSAGVFPWSAQLASEHLALAFGLLALSVLCYLIGQSVALGTIKTSPRTDRPDNLQASIFFSRWAWSIAFFAVLLAIGAGPSNLFVARFERGDSGFEGITQQLLFISRSIGLLAMVMLIYLSRFAQFPRLRRQNTIVALIFLPLFFLINFPPALPRFVLFGIMIALSCTFVNYTRPAMKALVTALALSLLYFVFPIAKFIASGEFTLSAFLNLIGTVAYDDYILRSDFDGFMWITSTIEYLQSSSGEILWGYNFLGVLLFFIPRAVWSAKPVDTGEIVSTAMGYWYTNVASPLPAEALMAFGIAGPIVVFLLAGYAISRIETATRFPGEGTSRISSFFLYAMLMGFITIILRGALNGVAPQFASAFLVYAIMMFMRRHRIVWGRAR